MAIDDPRDPDEEIDENEGQDAGLDDDEGGGEADREETTDEEAEEGLVAEPQSRGEKRFQKLANEVKAEREARAALEKEMQQLRAERAQRENTPKGESPEEEAMRLSLMTSDERTDYKLAKAKREHDFAINVMRFQSADREDRASYTAKAATDTRYKKYEQEVETLLAEERRVGHNPSREIILDYLIGRNMRLNGGAARDKAKKEGAARIQSQTARADSGRSDRAPARRNESGNDLRALEKRLEGIPI